MNLKTDRNVVSSIRSEKKFLTVASFFVFVILAGTLHATDVTDCGIISSGTYILQNDVESNDSAGLCFNITSSDVILDCNNNTISNLSDDGYGVWSDVYNNLTITNCNFVNTSYPIYIAGGTGLNISYNDIVFDDWVSGDGIILAELSDADDVDIHDNSMIWFSGVGMGISVYSGHNVDVYSNSLQGVLTSGDGITIIAIGGRIFDNILNNMTFGIHVDQGSDSIEVYGNNVTNIDVHAFWFVDDYNVTMNDNDALDFGSAGVVLDSVVGSSFTNNNISGYDGFRLYTNIGAGSESNIIENNIITAANYGIMLEEPASEKRIYDLAIKNNQIQAVEGIWEYDMGYYLYGWDLITIFNNTITASDLAIGTSASNNTAIENNTMVSGGVILSIGENTSFNYNNVTCNVESYDCVMFHAQINGVMSFNNIVATVSNVQGLNVATGATCDSRDSVFIGNSITSSDQDIYFGHYGAVSTNETFINFTLKSGGEDVVISFIIVDNTTISIGTWDITRAPDPSGYSNLSKYLSIFPQLSDEWIYLNVSFVGVTVPSGFNANDIKILQDNGTWNEISGWGTDYVNKYSYANVTSFSDFGVFAAENGGAEVIDIALNSSAVDFIGLLPGSNYSSTTFPLQLTIFNTTNVAVNVSLNASGNFVSGGDNFEIGNLTYSNSTSNCLTEMTTSFRSGYCGVFNYYDNWVNVPDSGSDQYIPIYFWIQVPSGQIVGNYTTKLYVKVEKA